jgi:DNA-binding MarR family transcriptional regulator
MTETAEADVARMDPLVARAVAILSLIHGISNRMAASGTTAYARFDLGLLEARILYVVPRSPPMPSSKLSVTLGVDPAAISRSVARLGKQQLITKAPGPRRNLTLTPAGLSLADTVAAVFEERAIQLVSEVADQDLDQMQQILERLQCNLARVAAVMGDPSRC